MRYLVFIFLLLAGFLPAQTISTVSGVSWSNIATVAGVSNASIATVSGVSAPSGGCSAPVFRSAAEAYSGTGGNSITIAVPAGTVEGDLLVASVYFNDRNQGVVAPSGPFGWTLIDYYEDGDPSASVGCWYKIAGASEPADYTWFGIGSVSRRGGTMACFSGSYDSDPTDAAVAQTQNSPVSAGITTANDCAMVLYFSGIDSSPGSTFTEPSGWTSAGADDGSASTYIGYLYQETAGATGTISYNTGEWNFVWSFIRND